MSTKTEQDDIPDGQAKDNTYVSHGESHIPVQKDEAPVEDPIDPATADTDEQLEKDDAEAIDKSNILGGSRTRGAGKPKGTYTEPGDEEGMPPPDDGTSNIKGY